ncbi:unnamed protein product [Protopolystoma xenopodis]|uniref:Uncharacterized protein n=1 Tax=Protopolystoma xenopodis TaxID=117903 RepID=A0A3S5A7F6_9PLAT|nr:unnamed protein product [Protopolystoma xenopodis]
MRQHHESIARQAATAAFVRDLDDAVAASRAAARLADPTWVDGGGAHDEMVSESSLRRSRTSAVPEMALRAQQSI